MTKRIHPALVAMLTVLCLTLSCSSMQREDVDRSPVDPERAASGELELLNVTANPQIDALTFRGVFRNHFNEPIDGIRIVLRVLEDPSETSPELARAQKILDAHLEPSEHVPFEITAEVAPKSLANVGLFLNGFAVRRGGEELPIPSLWQ